MNANDSIQFSIAARLSQFSRMHEATPVIDRICEAIANTLRAGGKVLTCGNGGSAAEALHMSEEMVGRFSRDRRPLAAICLAADPTALTCIANDFGFEEVFARQVAAHGKKGDVLIALSTSGKSPNILKALERARSIGLVTIGLLGPLGSPAEAHCDLTFTPNAEQSAHTQEMHLMVIHLILEQLDAQFAE